MVQGLIVAALAGLAQGAVAPKLTVATRYDYYTSERQGQVMVTVPAGVAGKALAVDVLLGDAKLAERQPVAAGFRTLVTVDLGSVPEGEHRLVCRLMADGTPAAEATCTLRKLPPRANEVKVDRASGGLIADGLPLIPFGFYTYFPVSQSLIDGEVIHGFTHLSPYHDGMPGAPEQEAERLSRIKSYMDRAAAVGMKVHYQMIARGGMRASEEKWRSIRRDVEMFRDHPALLAWYIADEPEGHGTPPAVLEETYRFIKELDPYHPITIVIMSPEPAARYANAMDIVMVDPYPIPHGPVTVVGASTGAIARQFEGQKPVWCVPQAFGGGEWWQREPTAQEERVMTYLALTHGARGIQYFIRSAPNSFPKSPIAWGECARMAMEVAEITPALVSGEPRPKVSTTAKGVDVGAWAYRGQVLILAANTENQPRMVQIRLDGSDFTGKALVPFENREAEVKRGVIEEPIMAYGTLAYLVPVGPPQAEARAIERGNLLWNPSYELAPSVGTPEGHYAYASGGATYFIDPRVAVHGTHSLRLTSPDAEHPVGLGRFPVSLANGQPYSVTVWAKAKAPGPRLELSLQGLGTRTFELTTEWRKYAIAGTCPGQPGGSSRPSAGVKLVGPGTAWLDLMQVTPDPAIQVERSIFIGSTTVTLSTALPDVRLHYTLDGTEPTNQSPLYSGPFVLSATTTVKARAFAGTEPVGGTAVARLTRVTPRAPDAPTGLERGVRYACYEGSFDRLPDLSGLRPARTGSARTFDLDARTRDERFVLAFEGFVSVPRDGIYTFVTQSDDGSRLYIGDQLVVDNDGLHTAREASGVIALAKGRHSIRVLYLQGAGGRALSVSYEGPGIARRSVPASALWRRAGSG